MQPALAHGTPLYQEASQGGMAFFVAPHEESGKAGCVLPRLLFLLVFIGPRVNTPRLSIPSPPSASFPLTVTTAYRVRPFATTHAHRHSKDTMRLGLLGAQPAARAVFSCTRLSLSSRCRYIFLSLASPPTPTELPSSTRPSAIQLGVSMYPIYRRATQPPSTTAAATASTTATAAITSANCIDGRGRAASRRSLKQQLA